MKTKRILFIFSMSIAVLLLGALSALAATYSDVGAGDTQRHYDFEVNCCGDAAETGSYYADNEQWAVHSEYVEGDGTVEVFLEDGWGDNLTSKYTVDDDTDLGIKSDSDIKNKNIVLNVETNFLSAAKDVRGHWAE
jgi:hypothetical protein